MNRELAAMGVVLTLVWLLLAFWAYQSPPSGRLGSLVIFSGIFGPIWLPIALLVYKRYLQKNWDRE